jgi:plasmid stability protein
MATLHVRNVPETLYRRLQKHAASSSRSLSAEVVELLHRGLTHEESRAAQASLLAGIRRRRQKGKTAGRGNDSLATLRADRAR